MARKTRAKTDSQKTNVKQLLVKDDAVFVQEMDVESVCVRESVKLRFQDVGSQTQKRFEVRDLFTRLLELIMVSVFTLPTTGNILKISNELRQWLSTMTSKN